jgi:beta-aspartyl-peptidase (threonine type)
MRTRVMLFFLTAYLTMACETKKLTAPREVRNAAPVTLVIHGGAGTIRKQQMTPEREKAYHDALKQALDTGYAVLLKGGKSVDAVTAAVCLLEDSPLFNAGKGAVFTSSGENELDASIMDGSNLQAGAVAGVKTIKNPIKAAYAVMTQSPHVMLSGKGAEMFAKERGLEIVDPKYFIDSARYEQFLRQQKSRQTGALNKPAEQDKKFGTVGAVALDRYGNLAAGTSTGGMSNKKWGRIGDSPIIGAGTYANNNSCGVSATGWGEYFIRLAIAHDISALMEYAGLSLQQAADSVIMKRLPRLGGDGGIIALDRNGTVSMTFNTEGMYRGYIRQKGEAKTFLYREDTK